MKFLIVIRNFMAVYFHLKRGEKSDTKSTEVACLSSFIVKVRNRDIVKARTHKQFVSSVYGRSNKLPRTSPDLIEDLPIIYLLIFIQQLNFHRIFPWNFKFTSPGNVCVC